MKPGSIGPEDVNPVTQRELEDFHVRPREGAAPNERQHDLLERYLEVPNKMLFLYSGEDETLGKYIKDHWSALDAASGLVCDIYVSLLQLADDEDIYSFLDDLRFIPGSNTVRLDKLPSILLWSDSASINISLSHVAHEKSLLVNTMRGIFQILHNIHSVRGTGFSQEDEPAFSALMSRLHSKDVSPQIVYFNGSVAMTTNNADRGGVILSDNAQARDISTRNTSISSAGDVQSLVAELAQLRAEMKKSRDDNDPTHDIAIGRVAAAEEAARSGDKSGAAAMLKGLGTWALGIAEKIGVGLVVAVIKGQMGV